MQGAVALWRGGEQTVGVQGWMWVDGVCEGHSGETLAQNVSLRPLLVLAMKGNCAIRGRK